MGRIKRKKIRGYEEIKERCNNNLSYAQVNNEIFDQVYEQGKITEADLILLIFLQIMHINKIALNKAEIARYLNISDRQVRDSIKKLNSTKAKSNSSHNPYFNNLEIVDMREVNLVTIKDHKAFNPKTGKNQKTDHFYVDFLPPAKTETVESKEITVYHSYFNVHIDEFDLIRDGVLGRKEFIVYLFINRIHNESRKNPICISISKISERLNIKMTENTYKYIQTLIDAGLITETKPANYDFNIENGIEPSCGYTPVYNLSKVAEANLKERGSDSSKKAEVNFQKTEVNTIQIIRKPII
jgi:predicted transcriptional regulator